jgi:signal transduction histidine kinase
MPAGIDELSAQDDDAHADRRFRHTRPGSTNHRHELEVDHLRRRIETLEHEKEALEAFAAVAAHELLQPLILAEAYVALIGERLGADQHADTLRDLESLARGARRGRMLVETLLYDARTDATDLAREPIDLNVVVSDCLTMLQVDLTAVEVDVHVERLPVVNANEALIAGVYKNLLLNAIKYAPRSGSTILVGSEADNDGVRLFVQSDGATIPEEERAQIFEPFVRGHGDRRARGSGLGLAVCRSIVERHGGHMGVAGGVPEGNRFYFTLPG